jgi:hypothetical protein
MSIKAAVSRNSQSASLRPCSFGPPYRNFVLLVLWQQMLPRFCGNVRVALPCENLKSCTITLTRVRGWFPKNTTVATVGKIELRSITSSLRCDH